VYHQNFLGPNLPPGAIWATPITEEFVQAGPPRLLFEPLPKEDHNHVWAPSFISSGNKLYMFYDSGLRLHSRIRFASVTLPSRQLDREGRNETAEPSGKK
jgi:hypothetical protein